MILSFLGLLAARTGAGVIQATPGIVVVCESSASEPEKHAASELSAYLSQISGRAVPVEPPGLDRGATHLFVGQGRIAARLCPDIPWAKLDPEEIVLRTAKGGIVIAGGAPRGTLYAVNRLLETLGVRWWTPWATDVPQNKSLRIPALNIREKPVLEYRAPYWFSLFNPEWAEHNDANYGMAGLNGKLGGGVEYAGFVHTYYALVPPAKYFGPHPEWFSLINGKRTADNAQLCTTDPELRKVVLQQVKEELKANPSATIVSVSQNDCFNQCQCDRCQALAKAEGSQSAPVLALANYVADGIKTEFPHVAVDTLAYQWSRHAPQTLRPLPNVIVRLCSIECDFGVPLNAPKNATFSKDVMDWSRLTNRLYVWDYVTNFGNYMQPMPDEAVLGPNLSFLASNGVKGVFEEGDYSSNGGSMSELKGWLLAKLLWNPKANDKALTHEFISGYFGESAEPIEKYLALMESRGAATAVNIFQGTNAPYLSYATLRDSELLWRQAEQLADGDPKILWRVRQAHLPVTFVFLKRWDELHKAALDAGDPWPFGGSRADVAKQWLYTATGPGPVGWKPATVVSESGETSESFVKSISGKLP